MKTSAFRFFLFCLLIATVAACSKEEPSGIKNLFIEAEKDLVILGIDTIKLSSIARDQDLKIVEDIIPTYSVNGSPIQGNTYVPTAIGSFDFVGMYQGVESNTETVVVSELSDEIERLDLRYNGNKFLTTNPWSLSGIFSFNAVFNNLNFDIPFQEVELFSNGEKVSEDRFLHFTEAGTYRVTASFLGEESNPIFIQVREEIEYEEITIPVIFHTYGVDYPSSQYLRILDSLNSAFSRPAYSLESVKNGFVDPNAVDCRIKFEMHPVNKAGDLLPIAGVHEVESLPNQQDSLLVEMDFDILEAQYNLHPDSVINFWVLQNVDFEWPSLNEREINGSGDARGLANTPVLATLELDGIPTLNSLFSAVDTTGVSHSIILRGESLFGTHPDFIVNRVGYFLGLFDTHSFGCEKKGDHCNDTFAPNFDEPHNGTNTFPSCSQLIYRPNNHMGILTKKTCFTYDQRERMRFILEHGLNRPGK